MTLRNGNFYKDGVKVPIEFGNKDQIQLLKKAKELNDDGVLAYVNELGELLGEGVIEISYTCLCGCLFKKQYYYDEWNNLQHDKFKCEGCDLNYILDGETFNPFVVVKLK